ncbi:ribosomal protein L30p/L7e-domain-containing protein [Sordaria brevicollis]|uniref:Large ribosomal subunit protein uL30m n=1 Tax=Sordaria brevicollis TaxID=83679 RepID=A0AAE0PCH2_SORBR|nr:ribosomal protein L30p/L7e-domain-containing protein [Sordaria brevicollis]
MSFFRITLHRSAIGLPKRTHGVLAALGLRKRNQTVFHPVEPQFAGMLMKVKELVRVEEVPFRKTKRELKDERKPEPGFVVEKMVKRFVPGEGIKEEVDFTRVVKELEAKKGVEVVEGVEKMVVDGGVVVRDGKRAQDLGVRTRRDWEIVGKLNEVPKVRAL